MVTKATKLLSVREVALRFGVTHQQVVRAIRAGSLKATKVGWMWVLEPRDLPDQWGEWSK